MFVSDEALLDVSVTAAQTRLPGTLLLPGMTGLRASSAVVADAVACAAVPGRGRLATNRKPDSGRPCAMWFLACPGVG